MTDEILATGQSSLGHAFPPGWRCFHCGEVFTDEHCARDHFGKDETREPGCLIKAGAERSILTALRHAEDEAAEAWQAIHNETIDAAKAHYAQAVRHREQLRAAEELGFERGLRAVREAVKPTHRHIKSGHEVRVIGEGIAQISSVPIQEMGCVVIYEHGGLLWVRAVAEFNDGRFTPL